VRKNF
jgi:hypothetical protein